MMEHVEYGVLGLEEKVEEWDHSVKVNDPYKNSIRTRELF